MDQWRPTLVALDLPTRRDFRAREANLVAGKQSPGQAAYAVMALSGLGEIDAAFDVAEGFLLSNGNIVTRSPTDRRNMLVNNSGWRQTQWLSTPPLGDFVPSPVRPAMRRDWPDRILADAGNSPGLPELDHDLESRFNPDPDLARVAGGSKVGIEQIGQVEIVEQVAAIGKDVEPARISRLALPSTRLQPPIRRTGLFRSSLK